MKYLLVFIMLASSAFANDLPIVEEEFDEVIVVKFDDGYLVSKMYFIRNNILVATEYTGREKNIIWSTSGDRFTVSWDTYNCRRIVKFKKLMTTCLDEDFAYLPRWDRRRKFWIPKGELKDPGE